jgi:hypothetical protein
LLEELWKEAFAIWIKYLGEGDMCRVREELTEWPGTIFLVGFQWGLKDFGIAENIICCWYTVGYFEGDTEWS